MLLSRTLWALFFTEFTRRMWSFPFKTAKLASPQAYLILQCLCGLERRQARALGSNLREEETREVRVLLSISVWSVFTQAPSREALGFAVFISPVTFNYTPATVDFFLLFSDNAPLSPTFRFSFLTLVSEAFSIRETGAEVLTVWVYCEASVAGGCRVEVPGVWGEVAGLSMTVDGALRSTV